jgi:hypothetical protein
MLEGYKSRNVTARAHSRTGFGCTCLTRLDEQRAGRYDASALSVIEKVDVLSLFSGAMGRFFDPLVTKTLTLSWR